MYSLKLFSVVIFFLYTLGGDNQIPTSVTKSDDKKVRYENIVPIFEKKKVNILITDSGLGGLSIAAGLDNNFEKYKIFEEANLIFFNALPEANFPYNEMKSEEEKIKVFDRALNGMIRWYNPDIILIACNTLSVIYPKTKFSQTVQLPVFGIVEFGVEMMTEKMKTEPNSSLIILGTETTISSDMHKNKLIQSGISGERISTYACKYLESEIQADPNSDIVKNLIECYITEALGSVSKESGKIFLGLCCTHYGYCSDVFKQTLEENGVKNFEIVDPNDRMIQFLSLPKYFDRFNNSLVNVEVVSRSVINDAEKESIGNALKCVSEKTTQALKEYKLKEDLFYFAAK